MELQQQQTKSRRRKAPPTPITVLEHVTQAFRHIDKNKLRVPVEEYQRDEAHGLIAKEIAIHFNIVAFGALTVIERSNGAGSEYLVADGGTRLAGAMMREDIVMVPCMVYSGLTREEEADVFLAINQTRKRLGVEQLQHAQEFAGDELALRVAEILASLKVHRVDFNGLGALRRCVRGQPKATDTVIALLYKCAPDLHVGVRVFKGLVYLEQAMNTKRGSSLNERTRLTKLKTKFGQLDAAVNAAFKTTNIRTSDPVMCARAIAGVLGVQFPRD
jgi:hypothetical protein